MAVDNGERVRMNKGGKEIRSRTKSGVHDLENRERLSPFREFSHTTGYMRETDQRDQKEHAGEDGEPED